MTFSKEFIEVCEYLGNKFGIAFDWSSSNIIPKLEELSTKFIHWEISTSIFWIGLSWVLFLFCFGIFTLVQKRVDVSEHMDHGDKTVFISLKYIALSFIGLVAIFISAGQIYDIITCLNLPEKVIIEYLMQLKNTMTH